MKLSEIKFIFFSFLIWRVFVLVIASLSIIYISLFGHNYLGGGYSNYILNPLFWGHLNFDGEHYLAISQNGYQPLEYFFFPLFPFIVKILSFNNVQTTLAATGILVSNISFFVALIGIYKLVKLDYNESIAKLTIILFLIFPTSFYFGVFYTESFFLMLVIWTFYFSRAHKFLFASIVAAFASATRLVGGVLFPVLFLEMIVSKRKNLLPILVAPVGILLYMYYLLKKTGDPLVFLHQVSIFGEQRSSTFILLPQVFYRYFFEILPHVTYSYFPNVFTTFMELGISILFLCFIVYGIYKLRLSYLIYAVFAFVIPTLSGSFSSMPRYVLVIFPIFILSAVTLDKLPKTYRFAIFFVMIILMTISIAMFWRGYWIS